MAASTARTLTIRTENGAHTTGRQTVRRRESLVQDGYSLERRSDWAAIMRVVRKDPVAQNAKDLLMKQMLKGGIRFALRDTSKPPGGKRKRPRRQPSSSSSSSSSSAIAATETIVDDDDDEEDDGILHNGTEWDRFLNAAIEEFLDFGSVTVQRVLSKGKQTVFPGVLPITQHERWFRQLPGHAMEMLAVWTGLSEAEQRLTGMKNGEVIANACVFTLFEPSADGHINSPSMRALPLVNPRLGYWRDFGYSSFWAARPTHAFEHDSRGAAHDVAENDGMSIDDMGKQLDQRRRDAQRNHVRITKAITQEGAVMNSERIAAIRRSTAYMQEVEEMAEMVDEIDGSINPFAYNPPFANALPVLPGQHLVSAPTPQAQAHTLDAIILRSKEIFAAYNVPPTMGAFEKVSQLASTNELALAGFNETVQQNQRAVEPLFAAMYEWVYATQMDMFEAHFIDTVQEVAIEHSKRKSAAAAATSDNNNTSAAALRHDGVFDEPMKAAARALFRGTHRIEARLPFTAMGEYERLQRAYADGLVDQKRFRKHAAPLLGIPESDVSREVLPHARTFIHNPGAAMLPEMIKAKTATKPSKK